MSMPSDMTHVHSGRSWLFPEPNINTDILMPSSTFGLPRVEQAAAVLATVRPGWAQSVEMGDILVGGRNFGTGSARQVPLLLLDLGIQCLVADSISDLFYRNSINLGLPVLECKGVSELAAERTQMSVELVSGVVTNCKTGRQLQGFKTPPALIEILASGGLAAQLKSKGHVR